MCYYVNMKEKSQKTKSIKLNYIYNVSYQILTLITPLITTPYLSRVLEVDGIGLYSFTSSLVSYFIMFAALGTLNYGNREISYLQTDRKKRTQVFWEIELLSCISVAVCLFAYFIFTIFLYHKYTDLLLLQSLCLVSVAADIAWLLQGLEEFGKIVGRNVVFKFVNIVFIFAAVHSKSDLILYVAGMCILELLSNLSIWLYLPKYVDRPKLRELHPFSHLRATIALFIPTVATTLYTALDKTMLNGITGATIENGYYEQANKISKMVLTLVTSLGAVMLPRIGKCFSENKKEEVNSLLYRSFQFVWFLGFPLCFGLMGIAHNFSPWFYGKGYDKVPALLIILALLIPIIGVSNVIGIQYLITTKRENLLTRSVCIGAIINFIFNLILIPYMYSYGAAIASVISELVITILQLWYIRKELSIIKIFCLAPKYLLSGVIMLLVLTLLSRIFPSSIIYTCIMIVSGFAVYMLSLLIMRDHFLLELISDITSKIRRR